MYKDEVWGYHVEYPNYLISSYGDKIYSNYIQNYLKFHKNENGYYRVNILDKYKNKKSVFVHKLVLETFVGFRPKFHVTRHYPDQDPTNNNIENLSWTTCKQNNFDRFENNTYCQAYLTLDEVILIKDLLICGATHIDIQNAINKDISAPVISGIRHGNVWKDIGPDISMYEFRKGGGQKLTINQVKTIKQMLKSNYSQSEISRQFNIHQSAVSNIKTGKSYSEVII